VGELYVRLRVINGPTSFYSNTLYRSADGTTWVELINDLEEDGTFDDWEVPLNTEVYYKVRTYGPGGSYAESVVQTATLTATKGFIMHHSDDPLTLYVIDRGYDMNISDEYAHDVEFAQYDGRSDPVLLEGESRSYIIDMSFHVVIQGVNTDNNWPMIKRILETPGPLIVRFLDGTVCKAKSDGWKRTFMTPRMTGYSVSLHLQRVL
jgi:hypothetical protein